MGVVYRATHLRLERTVALKLIAPALAPDPAFVSRFEREWRLMAALEHPNVIGIYEAGEVDGRLYLAMRWVAGGDLAARLRGTAGLDPRVALELLGQVAAALDAAHQRGVVHRDIKPANVLLDGEHAWLTDFGAGKDLAGRDTQTAPGRWVGTVDYVAPELLDGADPTPGRRRLLARLRAVRGADRPRAVPARHRGRDAVGAPLRAAAVDDRRPPGAAARARRRPAADAGQGAGGAAASAGEALRAARAAVTAPPAGAATVVGAPADAGDTPRSAAAGDTPPARPRRALLAAAAVAARRRRRGHGARCSAATTPRRRRRATRALEPFVDRIALGEGATRAGVAANPTFAFVTDGPNREVIQVLSSSRKVAATDQAALTAARSRADQRRPAPLGHARGPPARGHRPARRASGPTSGSTSKAATSRSPASDVVVLSPDGDGRLQRVDPETHRTVGEPYHARRLADRPRRARRPCRRDHRATAAAASLPA